MPEPVDFDLEHTGVPPSSGTAFVSTRVIEPSDPTTLGSITYTGRGERPVWIWILDWKLELETGAPGGI